MADFNVSGMLGLDASEFVGGADEATGAMEDVSGEAENTADSLFEIDSAGVAAGGAMAGIGTAAQGALDSTQSMRETLGRTATSTEMTREQTGELASEMQNATFPMEDVTNTMDSLAKQGISSEEQMREVANSADLVADATGTSAESIADNAVPAIRAMGGEAGDLTEHMDTFTYVARNTTMDVEDFSRVVTKMGPELQEMGMSVDDTATIMAALEEKGLDSRTAMREFRQAARDAEGDQEKLKETLGLTENELRAQEKALKDAEGSTKEHADAANESLSTMDELRAGYEDIKFQASEMLGPIDAIAPAMQTAGMMAMTMSTINFSAVIPSLVGVATAAAPVVIPLLAITAAVGALYYAWQNNIFGIRDITEKHLGFVLDFAEKVKTAFPNSIGGAVSMATDFFRNFDPIGAMPSVSDMKNYGSNAITGLTNGFWAGYDSLAGVSSSMKAKIWDAVPSYGDVKNAGAGVQQSLVNGFWDRYSALSGVSSSMKAKIWDAVPSYSNVKTAGGNVLQSLVNGVWSRYSRLRSASSSVKSKIWDGVPSWGDMRSHGRNLISGLISGIKSKLGSLGGAASDAAGTVRKWFNRSDAEVGPLSDTEAAGAALPETLAKGAEKNSDRLADAGSTLAEKAKPGMEAGAGAAGAGAGGVVVELRAEDPAMDALFDAIEPHVLQRIQERESAQRDRANRLGTRT